MRRPVMTPAARRKVRATLAAIRAGTLEVFPAHNPQRLTGTLTPRYA